MGNMHDQLSHFATVLFFFLKKNMIHISFNHTHIHSKC